jgi:hypothetical protein
MGEAVRERRLKIVVIVAIFLSKSSIALAITGFRCSQSRKQREVTGRGVLLMPLSIMTSTIQVKIEAYFCSAISRRSWSGLQRPSSHPQSFVPLLMTGKIGLGTSMHTATG